MSSQKTVLTIDGLIAIANAHGLVRYEAWTVRAAEASEMTGHCRMVLPSGVEFSEVSMSDAVALGLGKTGMWLVRPEIMIRQLAVEVAIRFHFADAVKAAENAEIRNQEWDDANLREDRREVQDGIDGL